jgi:hypothetical protein
MKQRITLTYTPAIIVCSDVKLLLTRLSHHFPKDVSTVAKISNSALKDPLVKESSFSCRQAIISSFFQLCVREFTRKKLS